MNDSVSRMTLGEHLEELRLRLVWALLGLLPIVAVAMVYGTVLLNLVLEPTRKALRDAGQPEPFAPGMLETFSSYMLIAILASVVVGGPWLLFQFWRFVSPGLHRHERRFVYFLLPLSAILTASGVVFLYTVVLPLVASFLVTFGTTIGARPVPTAPVHEGMVFPSMPVLGADPAEPGVGDVWFNSSLRKLRVAVPAGEGKVEALSIDAYRESGIRQQYSVGNIVNFTLLMILAFAGAFQAPVVVLLLGWVGLLDRTSLGKYRRHAAITCAIIAAAIMPGDPASMFAMMIPLYVLYELGGLLLWLFPAARVAGRRETEEDAP